MSKIITRRKTEEAYTVQHQIGLGGTLKGEVGLEIEVEGNKFPKPPGYETTHTPVPLPESKLWSYVHDGSLRGADNAEYVLTTPLPFSEIGGAVDEIFKRLDKHGSKIVESNRTSVHVHLNVRDFFLNRLTALMCLWIIFEQPLTEWCGDNRVGNLFCLRAKDTTGTVTHLKRFIRSNMTFGLRDGLHYAGMNAHAVVNKGSLEFRTLQGTKDPETIKTWVKILKRLYDLSAEYPDPRQIVEGFSGIGPMVFFDQLLGDMASEVRRGIEMSDDSLRESLYDSIRLAQDLAYAKDWNKFKPIVIKTDVFGRTKGKRTVSNYLVQSQLSDLQMELAADLADDEGIPLAEAVQFVVTGGANAAPPATPNTINFAVPDNGWIVPEWGN